MSQPAQGFFDGWQSAVRHLRATLDADGAACCLSCALDQTTLAGIAAALPTDLSDTALIAAMAGDIAAALVETAGHPDDLEACRVIGMSREVVTHQPVIAADIIATYAITLALHAQRRQQEQTR